MMLLPIAYFTFLMMMNSKSLCSVNEKPQGGKMLLWNMLDDHFSVGCARAAAGAAIWDKASHPTAGSARDWPSVFIYLALVVIGFIV